MLHKLNNFACYTALAQKLSKIQSSRKMSQFLASECNVLSALKQNVGDGLSSFAAVAAWVYDSQHSPPEEEVLHSNLFRTDLDVRGALPLAEVLVWLQYFWCRYRYVPEGGPAPRFLLPLCLPSSLDDFTRPLL